MVVGRRSPCNQALCPPCISVKITQSRIWNILVCSALITCIAVFGGYGNAAVVQGNDWEGFAGDHSQTKPRDVSHPGPHLTISLRCSAEALLRWWCCVWLTPLWGCGAVSHLTVRAGACWWPASREERWMGRAGSLITFLWRKNCIFCVDAERMLSGSASSFKNCFWITPFTFIFLSLNKSLEVANYSMFSVALEWHAAHF